MRVPNESLDDFFADTRSSNPPEPPRARRVQQPKSKFVVLRPIVRSHYVVKKPAAVAIPVVSPSMSGEGILGSWGRRSLDFAGGLAVILLILASRISIYDSSVDPLINSPELALDRQSEEILMSTDDSDLSGSMTSENLRISDRPNHIQRVRRPSSAEAFRAAYRPRRSVRRPHIVETRFVPTTLVIYATNGEIRTRIEPQFPSSYRR